MNILNPIKKIIKHQIIAVSRYLEKIANKKYYNYPFGRVPRALPKSYMELFDKVKNQSYPEITAYEKKLGLAIDKDWLDNLALHTQITIKDSPLCYAHGRVLYCALSKYLQDYVNESPVKKINIIETGTARGFSSLCMARALYDSSRAGMIITFDILPHDTEMYWNCIDDKDGPRTRAKLLEEWKDLVTNYIVFHQGDTRVELPKVQTDRVNFAFLDGAHTYEDVKYEFLQIKDRQKTGDIIVYDDYTSTQFSGLVKAVDEICSIFNYEKTVIHAHNSRAYVVAVKK